MLGGKCFPSTYLNLALLELLMQFRPYIINFGFIPNGKKMNRNSIGGLTVQRGNSVYFVSRKE